MRILISKNELDSAFNLINKIDPKRENHILIELLGDIYYKRGNIKLAKETYSHALQFNLTPNRLQIVEIVSLAVCFVLYF